MIPVKARGIYIKSEPNYEGALSSRLDFQMFTEHQ